MSENKQSVGTFRPGTAVFSRFLNFSLRTRLIVVITIITSIAVVTQGYFSSNRAQQTQTFLQDQLQVNVGRQAEEQLQSMVLSEANKTNQLISAVGESLRTEASYLQRIENQPEIFNAGTYWNAQQNLTRLPTGPWDNSNSDAGSVLVPSSVTLNDVKIAEINSYMYLDFFAPEILKGNNLIVATYFIDKDGVTVYYPNIDLANLVGNFDATSQTFYQIATPENNPKRLPVWTTPYQDPAGTGLIVTNSIPIYYKQNYFLGILGADVQLSTIAAQVASIEAGDSGYAFLIDSSGHIVALPEQGYTDLNIEPIDVPAGEPIKQTILGHGPEMLQTITAKMVAGQAGLDTAKINGVEKYVAFAPLPSVGYSLAIVVPSTELNGAYRLANDELDKQTKETTNTSLILIAGILLTTALVSWVIGVLLTNPLTALTTTAQRIADGDFSVQADTGFDDEIGTLAKAFNSMTARLRDSILNLETRVAERTNEISIANEKNQYQAAQLRAVAEIARSAASLKSLDELLPEITQRISDAFGVYHVSIFLLDATREYAVLKAANSEGGQRMLLRKHRLKVGQLGIVGFVTQTGQPRISLDVGADAVFFDNPDLPETHSELALPLTNGNEIIGALDVQSTQTAAFTNQDIDILGLLADQISNAIKNANLFEDARAALLEAQNAYTQSALNSWREINRQYSVSGFRYANGVTEALTQDNQQRGAELHPDNETLSIPIIFREQSLGALKIRQPGRTQAWRKSEIQLYQAIVDRLSFALENARLYVDAQKRASKERVIGEIGAKISGSTNLENILQTVVEEIGRTIPGSQVAIQFEEGDTNANSKPGGVL